MAAGEDTDGTDVATASDLSTGLSPEPEVEVRRSRRRRRTVSAYRDGDRVVVLMPASFSRAEEQRWVAMMVERLRRQERRRRPQSQDLVRRSQDLSRRYLGGRARPTSIRWVDNQNGRWGSCTPVDGTIRISSRLRGMPLYVLDYVLLHELAHLIEGSHSARFWALLEDYPKLERARGYLEGVAAASHLDLDSLAPPDAPDPDGQLDEVEQTDVEEADDVDTIIDVSEEARPTKTAGTLFDLEDLTG